MRIAEGRRLRLLLAVAKGSQRGPHAPGAPGIRRTRLPVLGPEANTWAHGAASGAPTPGEDMTTAMSPVAAGPHPAVICKRIVNSGAVPAPAPERRLCRDAAPAR